MKRKQSKAKQPAKHPRRQQRSRSPAIVETPVTCPALCFRIRSPERENLHTRIQRLGAKGISTRNKSLLVAPGLATRNKKLLVAGASLLVTKGIDMTSRGPKLLRQKCAQLLGACRGWEINLHRHLGSQGLKYCHLAILEFIYSSLVPSSDARSP